MLKICLYPVNRNGEKFPIQFYRPDRKDVVANAFLSHTLSKTYVDEEDLGYLHEMARLHNAEIVMCKID